MKCIACGDEMRIFSDNMCRFCFDWAEYNKGEKVKTK